MLTSKKVIVLCPEYFDGRRNGIGRVSEAMVGALARAGYEPFVWAANDSEMSADASGRGFGRRYFRMIAEAALGNAKGVCGVVSMHVGLSPVAKILAWRLGVPAMCWLYGVEVWRELPWRTQWGLRGNVLLRSISHFTRKKADEWNPGLRLSRAKVLPLGWMLPVPPERKERDSAPSGVLSVGRLSATDAYKGFDRLISSWKLVVRELEDAVLTIVGDGDDRSRLVQLADEEGVSHNVRFLGKVSNEELVSQYMSNAVFAMPSSGEGFGLVFAEAMAYGVPCVCGNADASPEVVVDGKCGFCVDARSTEAVAGALLEILRSPSKRKEFSDFAQWEFEEKFSQQAVEARMDSLVRELLER